MPRSLDWSWVNGMPLNSSPKRRPRVAQPPGTATLSQMYGDAGRQTEAYLLSLGLTPKPLPVSGDASKRRMSSIPAGGKIPSEQLSSAKYSNVVLDGMRLNQAIRQINSMSVDIAEAERQTTELANRISFYYEARDGNRGVSAPTYIA